MTVAEQTTIGLGLVAIVARYLWPTRMPKWLSYSFAVVGFTLLGSAAIIAIKEMMGMKMQSGPLTTILVGAAIVLAGFVWQPLRARTLPIPPPTALAAAPPNLPRIAPLQSTAKREDMVDRKSNNSPDDPAARSQRSGFSGNTVIIGTIEKCKIGVDIVGDASDNKFHVENAKDCETIFRTNKSPEQKSIAEKK